MRVSPAAVFALATLAVNHTTGSADAEPTQNRNLGETTAENRDVVVVPFVEEQPVRKQSVTAPETLMTVEFTPQNQQVVAEKPPYTLHPHKERFLVATNSIPVISSNDTDAGLAVPATDVQIVGANPELNQIIRQVIKTQVGGDTSLEQLKKDITAILDTGLFTSATFSSVTNPNGLSITYQVKPVVVQGLQLHGAKVLTYKFIWEKFQAQIGGEISPSLLKQSVKEINKWYADNGYVLGRVLSIKPNRIGILNINVAEGLVSNVKFRFLNDESKAVDRQGKPIRGRTKISFLQKQLKLQPGDVYQEKLIRRDVQTLYHLGLFKTVNVAFEGDANKVDLVYELQEASARSVNLGGGYNPDDGISVVLSYKDQNYGGVNDTLSTSIGANQNDVLLDAKFVSPYRASDPDRLGYTINAFRHGGLSPIFDDQIKLANGDKVRQRSLGGGASLQQSFAGWDASFGVNYTRTIMSDRAGNVYSHDANGNPLSWSGTGIDDLTTVFFTATKDMRDNPTKTTHGSLLSFTVEQSIPIGEGEISLDRLRGNYSRYIPVQLFKSNRPQVFAMNFQSGTVIGDLPPYDAFSLGGANSVRGYEWGQVGSGRSYVLTSAEYRIPVFPIAGVVLFGDFASDLGTGDSVLGNPAGVRGKPGTGFGYGAGLRIDSPLGLIRVDYGIDNQGSSRVQLGIGEKF